MRADSRHSLRPTAVPMAARGWGRGPAARPLPQRATVGGEPCLSPRVASHWLGRAEGGWAEEEPADGGGGGAGEGMEGGEPGGGGGLLQQILSLRLVPRVGNGTTTYSSPLSTFPGTLPAAGPARSGALRPAGPGPAPRPCLTALLSTEMWYGVFLWALVSSLSFHVPAALLALFTLRHHKYGRFMSVSLLLMGIVGPITAGILTSTVDASK